MAIPSSIERTLPGSRFRIPTLSGKHPVDMNRHVLSSATGHHVRLAALAEIRYFGPRVP